MFRKHTILAATFCFFAAVPATVVAQDQGTRPPPYRGVTTLVPGVFVTPIPAAPFTAVVRIESTTLLPDGSSQSRMSKANIARDSQGRIYNERRPLLPSSAQGTSPVVSSHIFDPQTRSSTLLDPFSHLARQRTMPGNRDAAQGAPIDHAPSNNPFFKQEDLGTEMMENVAVHGTRQTRTLPPATNGAGKKLIVTTESWYSDELHMNMLTRNDDPRTGLQVVTITQVNRNEPDPAIFQVPAGYKVIDENPPN